MDTPRRPIWSLSPVGTSVLTNAAPAAVRPLLFRHANAKLEEIGADDAAALSAIVHGCRAEVGGWTWVEAKRRSAELNGLLTWLDKAGPCERPDHHVLLASDTWLGMQTAEIVAAWLAANGLAAEVRSVPGLSTKSLDDFRAACVDIAEWLRQEPAGWSAGGYRVVFNLTGGWKGVLAFLQTAGLLFADESFYLFESGAELLTIPRLPVAIDTGSLRSVIPALRALDLASDGIPADQALGIPEVLLFQVADRVALSEWGTLLWGELRDELLRSGPLPPVSSRLRLGDKFSRAFDRLPLDRRRVLAKQLDGLERAALAPADRIPASLGLKKIVADRPPGCTHEAYAWSDQDARRLYGFYDGATFVVDHLGDHLPG